MSASVLGSAISSLMGNGTDPGSVGAPRTVPSSSLWFLPILEFFPCTHAAWCSPVLGRPWNLPLCLWALPVSHFSHLCLLDSQLCVLSSALCLPPSHELGQLWPPLLFLLHQEQCRTAGVQGLGEGVPRVRPGTGVSHGEQVWTAWPLQLGLPVLKPALKPPRQS